MCTIGSACTSNVANVSTYQATSTITEGATSDAYIIAAPTVPWLTVSPLIATVTTTQTLTFTVVAAGWQTLLPGLNTVQVVLNSPTAASITFTVSLQIQPAAATLSVKGGPNVLNPYSYTLPITAVALNMPVTLVSSTGLPVSFTVSTNGGSTTPAPGSIGTGWLTTSISSGIAYSWGTTFNVTANSTALGVAQPGDILTGTVTITPATGGGSAITMTVNILTAAPTPGALTVTPNLVPLLASGVNAGTVTFLVKGSGFVATPATQKTKVFYGLASGSCSATVFTGCSTQVVTDNVTIISSNYLQVAVPYSSSGVPFAVAGTVAAPSLYIGVANGPSPANASVVAPIGVTALPIISAVTNAASFVEPLPGTNPKAAPYDIISIFGNNLCPLCTGSSSVLLGAPDAWERFPTNLSPDSGTHKVTVTFSKPGTPTTSLPGYLLFASNTQINVTVPGNVVSLVNGSNVVNVTVGYDTATPPTNIAAYFPLNYAAVDPGIFTMESSGQGQAAILNYNSGGTTLGLNSVTNFPIGGASANDTVSLYLTGLGIPDSAGTNAANASQGLWTAASNAFNCIAPLGTAATPGTSSVAPTGFMDTVMTPYFPAVTGTAFQQPNASYAVPAPAWTSIDGAIMAGYELNTNNAVPCFLESDAGAVPGTNAQLTVTLVGSGGTATLTPGSGITYAGFVQDSIAGLYQINFVVPSGVGNGSSSGLASVTVTVGSSGTAVSSQALVKMYLE